jgi:hypothetical protein
MEKLQRLNHRRRSPTVKRKLIAKAKLSGMMASDLYRNVAGQSGSGNIIALQRIFLGSLNIMVVD